MDIRTGKLSDPFAIPGHPLSILRQENRAIETFLGGDFAGHVGRLQEADSPELRMLLLEDVRTLMQVGNHYRRIEALMLPILEAQGHVAAARVLQAVHRDVLRMIRDLDDDLRRTDSEAPVLLEFIAFLVRDIEMVIRQEREVYTAPAQTLVSTEQWVQIAQESHAYGYCMIDTPPVWEG